MPHCCRIETYTTKVVEDEIHGQMTTPLPANVVDFGKILRGTFPGCTCTDTELIVGFPPRWQTDFRIPYSTDSKAALVRLLNVLTWTVTIEDEADESHSLYLHKIPFPSKDTSDPDAEPDWKHSKVGLLVNEAKSYGIGSGNVKSAKELCDDKFLYWIRRHVRYQRADVILPAPLGNPNKSFDLPWFIANRLTSTLRIPLVTAQSTRSTEQQKSVDFDLEARYNNIAGKFSIPTSLDGRTVIALDDIYSSGATMTELVRAARAAGAKTVLGLTATKTARHTRGLTPSDWYKVTQEAAAGLTETSDA